MITPAASPPQAPDQMPVSCFDIQAPYAAGSPDAIYTGGDADAGGRDDVAGTVAGAQAAVEARYAEHSSDQAGQGSTIGDLMDLPPTVSEISKHTGGTGASGYGY